MDLQDMKIVIVGGGIAGLAAALALHAHGARPVLLEQAPAFREVGAGLQISPNGVAVLRALGLGRALAEVSCRGRAVSLRDGLSGSEVARLDLGDAPYWFVHRADLIDLLARQARAAGLDLRLGQAVADIGVEAGSRARVVFDDARCLEADLVVAADGLHSVMRRAGALNAARFTRQAAWRAVVPNTMGHPPEVRVHMGPGRHTVSYPLRTGSHVNLVAVEERDAWTEDGWTHTDTAKAVQRAFADFCAPVHQMMDLVEAPGLWGLFRRPVAKRPWEGRVALVGDAAHPTLPFLAQGANMALEDAWVLADVLTRESTLAGAAEAYNALRVARTERIVAAANGNAWKYHLRAPLVRRAAHLGLGLVSRTMPQRLVGQYDWLYGHDVTKRDSSA